MVFNTTFNNILVYRGSQFYWMRKPETILEKNRKLKEILRFKILYISLVPVLKLTPIILIIMEQGLWCLTPL
jgi:hypothetical protein